MTATWSWLKAWINRQDNAFEQADLPYPDCESSPVVFPDNETPVKFVFEATLPEIVKIISAIEKGATLSYPEEWHNVWWLFVRNLECEVTICDEVADCIETNETTQAALASAIRSSTTIQQALNDTFNPTVPGDSATGEYRNQDMMSTPTGCDNNAAWGHIRNGLIERSMQRVKDVLDQIEFTTDNQEMLANTIEAMPVFGVTAKAVGVTGIIDWFDNVREFLADAWEAGDTLEKRDQMACDLFCIWQENCSLSFEQVSQYFYENAADNFPSYNNAFIDIFQLLLAMADPTELIGGFVVDCLLGTMFGFQSFINQWFGVTIEEVSNDLLFGGPSDDWIDACDDCPEFWSLDIDFTASDGGFEAFVNAGQDRAVYSAGNGWSRAGTADDNQRAIIQIQRTGLSSFNLQAATIYCSEDPTFGYQLRMPDVSGTEYSSGVVGAGNPSVTVTPNADGTGLWLSASDTSGEDMTGFITRLVISGNGAAPF